MAEPSSGAHGDGAAPVAKTDWPVMLGPFGCFGQHFSIRTTDEELGGLLGRLYEPMRTVGSGRETVYSLLPVADGGAPGLVARDDEVLRSSERPDRLLATLVWAINRQVIDGSLDQRLVLHAAAADLDGAAVVLPAPMEAGKTTLVTGLLDRGFGYLSDEAVAVADDLTVEGYPKPLSIDRGSWQVLAHHDPGLPDPLRTYLASQWQVATQEFAPVVRQSRLALLVFPRYEPGAPLRLEPLTPASAVSELFPCIFIRHGERIPRHRLPRLARIAEGVPATRLIYGDLSAACEQITGVLAGSKGDSTSTAEAPTTSSHLTDRR